MQGDDLTDLRMHDPDVERSTQLNFCMHISDKRNNLKAVVGKHQSNILLVRPEKQWVWRISWDLILLPQVPFGNKLSSLGCLVETQEQAVKALSQHK